MPSTVGFYKLVQITCDWKKTGKLIRELKINLVGFGSNDISGSQEVAVPWYKKDSCKCFSSPSIETCNYSFLHVTWKKPNCSFLTNKIHQKCSSRNSRLHHKNPCRLWLRTLSLGTLIHPERNPPTLRLPSWHSSLADTAEPCFPGIPTKRPDMWKKPSWIFRTA
jgi:hypothetical protein